MSEREFVVKVEGGGMEFVYDDSLADLLREGDATAIERVSWVEFDNVLGGWVAVMKTPLTEVEAGIMSAKASHWFWKRTTADMDCWVFTGKARSGSGSRYGTVKHDGKMVLAHRVAYRLVHGEASEVVRHKCDNTLCVRPSHLEGGSAGDNVADAIARGRAVNGNIKLTPEAWSAIRMDTRSSSVVAAEYGVSPSHVRRIRRGVSGKAFRPMRPLRSLHGVVVLTARQNGGFPLREDALKAEREWLSRERGL